MREEREGQGGWRTEEAYHSQGRRNQIGHNDRAQLQLGSGRVELVYLKGIIEDRFLVVEAFLEELGGRSEEGVGSRGGEGRGRRGGRSSP
jgi:hypothetical protein